MPATRNGDPGHRPEGPHRPDRTGHWTEAAEPDDHTVQIPTRAAAPTRVRASGPRLFAATGPAIVGAAWLGIAGAVTWLVFATPLLAQPPGPRQGGPMAPVIGAAALAVALTAPAAFAILGIARLGGAATRARAARGSTTPVARRAAQLPEGCTVIPRIRLPDGRHIPDIVVGPARRGHLRGAAARRGDAAHRRSVGSPLLRPDVASDREPAPEGGARRGSAPPPPWRAGARLRGAGAGGRARRRARLDRIDGCAVVALDDVPAWLAALPAQRGLSADRLARVRDSPATVAWPPIGAVPSSARRLTATVARRRSLLTSPILALTRSRAPGERRPGARRPRLHSATEIPHTPPTMQITTVAWLMQMRRRPRRVEDGVLGA